MNKPVNKLLAGLVVLSITFSASYVFFTRYTPKALRQLSEVKGAFIKTEPDIPYPRGSQKISESETSGSKSIAIQTDKSPEEVQAFYRTVFITDGWELDSEGTNESFLTAKYKKDNRCVIIIASRQAGSNESIVMLELGKR